MDRLIMAVFLWGLVGCAQAATLYRWVDPEGVVTYQNTPPPDSVRHVKVLHLGGHSSPADVRKAASEMHPVVLYRAPHCIPCQQVSAYLSRRKVPFKTVNVTTSQAVMRAMKRKTGSTTVPTIMVGKQVLTGYLQSVLAEELTAAGYPHTPKK